MPMKMGELKARLRPIVEDLLKEDINQHEIEYLFLEAIRLGVLEKEKMEQLYKKHNFGGVRVKSFSQGDSDAPCDTEPSTVASNVVDISAWKS